MSGFASNTPLDDESVDRERQPQRVLEPPTFETSGRDSYVPPSASAPYSHNPQRQQQRHALQPQRTTSPFPTPPAAAPSSSTEPPPFYFYRKSPQRTTSPRTATQHRSPRGFDDSSHHRHGNGQYGVGASASTPSRLISGDSRFTASDARSYSAHGTTLGSEGIVSSGRHESVSVGAVSPRRFAAPVGFHVESTRQILTRIPPPVDSGRRDGLGRESYPVVTSTPPTVERYSVGAPNGSLGPAFDAAMPPRTTAVFHDDPTALQAEAAPGNTVAATAVPSVAVDATPALQAPPTTHRNIAHTTSSPELLMRQSAHSPASPERLINGESVVKPPLQRGAPPPERGHSDNGDIQERGHSPLSPARMSVPRRCTNRAAGYQLDTSSDDADGDAEAETAPGDVDATDDVALPAGDEKGNSKAENGRKTHTSALVESPNAPNEPLGARNRAIVLSPGQSKRPEAEFAAEDLHLDHEPVEADDDVERMKRQQSPDPRSMRKSFSPSVDENDPKRVASISQSVDEADVAKPPALPLGFAQEEPYVYREPCSFETYVVAALVFASLLVLVICAIGTAAHHHFWFIPMLIAGPLLLIGGPYVATLSFRVTLRFSCPENVMHFERSLLGTEHCMWRVTVPLQTVSISRDRGARVALRFGTACECVTVPDGPWEAHLCRLKSEAERWSPVSPNRRALSSGVA